MVTTGFSYFEISLFYPLLALGLRTTFQFFMVCQRSPRMGQQVYLQQVISDLWDVTLWLRVSNPAEMHELLTSGSPGTRHLPKHLFQDEVLPLCGGGRRPARPLFSVICCHLALSKGRVSSLFSFLLLLKKFLACYTGPRLF